MYSRQSKSFKDRLKIITDPRISMIFLRYEGYDLVRGERDSSNSDNIEIVEIR